MTMLLPSLAHAQRIVQPDAPCEQAGWEAERQFDLPAGLLDAIGRVESGRWDSDFGRVVASPFAVDAAGQPLPAGSKQAAIQQTRALQQSGLHNIDVGCFQINLRDHPTAFTDLEQAFDPAANAQYAARFLSSLHARLGTWEDAVAAYHSATPALGIPYRQLVFANWSTQEGWVHALPTAPDTANAHENSDAATIFSIDGRIIRVWTPSAVGHAAPVVAIVGAGSQPLPRVITPGG
jgi:hypothetical protein